MDAALLGIEGAEKGGDIGLIRAVPDPDPQPARVDAAHPSGDHGGPIGACDDISRFLEKEPTGLRRLDASFRSEQQPNLKVVFKLPNLMTQGDIVGETDGRARAACRGAHQARRRRGGMSPLLADVSEAIVKTEPRFYTTTFANVGREPKILIDYCGTTARTLRLLHSRDARPGAPVSMPLAWSDLNAPPDRWTLTTVAEHLKRRRTDPWAKYWACHQEISHASIAAARTL